MSVTKDIVDVLNNNTIKSEDISKVKEYLEALKTYDSLIKSGVTTKRGNNLLPRDKTYSPNIRFNAR